ncbi:MAG: GNAT family N-acetyltransferase [Candidatus Melainabacteria bacterium]|nr:GNAT family N-acetyltransferase [Candidatus Melainabacteria bacterium]
MVAGTKFKIEILEKKTDQAVCLVLRQIPYFTYEPTILEYGRETLKPFATTLMATSESGEAIGCAVIEIVNAITMEIVVMGVRPQNRRQGVGTALINGAEDVARSKDKKFLLLKTVGPSQRDREADTALEFFYKNDFCLLTEMDFVWQDYYCGIMIKQL